MADSRLSPARAGATGAKPLTAYRPFWAKRFGTAPFLPMSRAEMQALGWEACDVIIVTGDAYVDHPSFGMAVIGRVLEAQGFRVGIIAQPDWRSVDDFQVLGRPTLFFGVTAGNMDSMINHYTAERRIRSDDAYTPGGVAGRRPDRATLVYTQRCQQAYKDVPVILGGIEASLRRVAHYDYWSDKVRRSILVDSKADLLLYGNAERAIVEIAHRLAQRQRIETITDVRGTVFMRQAAATTAPEPAAAKADAGAGLPAIRLPSYEQVKADRLLYARASRLLHLEANPGNARALVQAHGEGAAAKDVWLNPPPVPLTTAEMDGVFGLPYARAPHPRYADAAGRHDGATKIPAWEMIRFSVNIMRGCFGGCTFCSITEHEGRIIQSRSEASVLREIEAIRDKTAGFTGVISDLGGPTANMYRLGCKSPVIEAACRKPSCLYPGICTNLRTDHGPLIGLYRSARAIHGVKKILIGSGLRYDLAVRSPEYVKELVQHHVGGYLKIAPEHTEPGPLAKMMKPGIASYDRFKALFDQFSREAGKEQFLIPYFIAAHPATTDQDMLNLALWLKRNGFRIDQVQTFYPSPMATASAMYHSGVNPLKGVHDARGPNASRTEPVVVVKGERQRRLHKAFLRWHDPANWPLLREALIRMGRADLIGSGKNQLVPRGQPAASTGKRSPRRKNPTADGSDTRHPSKKSRPP